MARHSVRTLVFLPLLVGFLVLAAALAVEAAPGNGNSNGNGASASSSSGSGNGHASNGAASAQEGPTPGKGKKDRTDVTAGSEGAQGDRSSGHRGPVPDGLGVKTTDDEGRPVKVRAEIRDLTPAVAVARTERGNALTWPTPPEQDPVVGFQVWRSLSPFALIATLPHDETSFHDEEAPVHAKYKVTAFTNATLEGGFVANPAVVTHLDTWQAEVYQVPAVDAITAASLPSPDSAPVGRGLTMGAGFLLLVIGLAAGREQVLGRASGFARLEAIPEPPRPRVLPEPELERFLELWEETGRPFPLDGETMNSWVELREAQLRNGPYTSL